jgi:hypothetical protein
MVWFRERRERVDESLQSIVELKDRAALVDHCRWLIESEGTPVSTPAFSIIPYDLTPDAQTGWGCTYLVMVYGYGPIGYTNGPL